MSASIEVKYFNSFLLKKTIKAVDDRAVWAGDPSNPQYYPVFPIEAENNNTSVTQYDWFVEESRIKGEFSGTQLDLGVRAYLKSNEKAFKPSKNSMIYSGIYNSRTGVNQSNVFSVGEDITRSLDPRYGGIEWMYSDESNLTIFQENKVSRALIDRDAIYSADGKPIESRSNIVIGDAQYYTGDYGIGKNPESFATDGNRRYFSDVPNGAILRLSNDGLTEISRYGMEDFFRDELEQISSEYKRYIVDVEWTIPWSTPSTTLVVSGDNIDFIEIGMAIEGIVGWSNLYVANVGTPSAGSVTITLSEEITVTASPQPSVLNLVKYVKDKVIGGFDDNYGNYTVSIVYNEPSRTATSELVTIPPEDELEPA